MQGFCNSDYKQQRSEWQKRWRKLYDIGSADLETRIMAVIDFVSGMTDVYALDFYQKINGISLPIV